MLKIPITEVVELGSVLKSTLHRARTKDRPSAQEARGRWVLMLPNFICWLACCIF